MPGELYDDGAGGHSGAAPAAAPAQAAPVAEAPASGAVSADTEWIKNANDEGKSAYEVHVILSTSCLLKAARAYMVVNRLEELGEIYKAIPSKGEEEYLYDDVALEKYRKKMNGKSFTLQRYKGLGEMDKDQLWETTLDPERRKLKLVEIEDALMASEVTEVLMGSDVAPRKEFIYKHAKEAELDY